MKLGILGAIAGVTAAAGAASAGTAAYLFDQVIVRKDKIPAPDTGTDWEKYKPMIHECKEWLSQKAPQTHIMKTYDGLKLIGRFLPADKPTHKTILAIHGYRSGGTNEFSCMGRMYSNHGYNIMIVDNRAHGESEGKYIGFGVLDHLDAMMWLDYILTNIDPDAEIYLHGVSMGGATVLMTSGCAIPKNVRGIIADCAFTSAWDVFAHLLPKQYHLPVFPLMNISSAICKKKAGYAYDELSTLDTVKKADVPILFIHGSRDDFVPVTMSYQNYEVCKTKKRLLIIDGADHGESFYHSPKLYENTVFEFINSIREAENDD